MKKSVLAVLVFISFSVIFALLSAHADSASAGEVEAFSGWLEDFRVDARKEGITSQTLDKAFARVKYNQLVIKLDQNQPEFHLSLQQYFARTLSAVRIKRGRKELQDNSVILQVVADKYGVPPHVLVALWGMETDFGRVTGGFPIIESLATLTFDPRRSAFFEKELLAALHLLEDGKVELSQMEGSWAGAMGYLQFLPSVLRTYGVDCDRNGKVEIWKNSADLFATASNYLAAEGWQKGRKWGREVSVPKDIDENILGLSVQKDLSFWRDLGVRQKGGALLSGDQVGASLIHPDSSEGRYFLIYNNFRVLMKWNRSTYYALAVGLLSDAIKE